MRERDYQDATETPILTYLDESRRASTIHTHNIVQKRGSYKQKVSETGSPEYIIVQKRGSYIIIPETGILYNSPETGIPENIIVQKRGLQNIAVQKRGPQNIVVQKRGLGSPTILLK